MNVLLAFPKLSLFALILLCFEGINPEITLSALFSLLTISN